MGLPLSDEEWNLREADLHRYRYTYLYKKIKENGACGESIFTRFTQYTMHIYLIYQFVKFVVVVFFPNIFKNSDQIMLEYNSNKLDSCS